MTTHDRPGKRNGLALAADIGGTQMRAAVVTSEGKLLDRDAIDTHPQKGIEDAAGRLAELVERIRKSAGADEVAGLGVSTAGPLDPDTGIYRNPPNLTGWDGKSMKPVLEKRLGVPVHIGHDATLAAFAETRFGPHRGAKNLVYVTVSTGVGGGIIANGEMVTGNGHAGEVGHITIRPGGDKCNVGCDGCFEGNASGGAVTRIARRRLGAGESSSLLEMAGGDPEKITSKMVFDAADQGDYLAMAAREEVIETIGIGLGSLLNIFDPDALVVGGGVMQGLKGRWDGVLDAVRRHSLRHFQEKTPVYLTTHGDDVSLVGAAALAFRNAG